MTSVEKGKVIAFAKSKKVKESVAKSSFDTRAHQGTIVVDNGHKIYKNHYFELVIKVPNSWITFENNELVKITQENVSKLNISEAEKNKLVEAMTNRSINLFRATPFMNKQPYGKNQRIDNPIINCVAHNVIMYPNCTSADFIEGTIENLKNGSLGTKYDMVTKGNPIIISGKRFDVIEAKTFINEGRDIVHSNYYSILIKGYQLTIITTCISEEGLEDLNHIVSNIKLN